MLEAGKGWPSWRGRGDEGVRDERREEGPAWQGLLSIILTRREEGPAWQGPLSIILTRRASKQPHAVDK